MTKIKRWSNEDEVIIKLREVICRGWPEQKHELPGEVIPYFHFRDELTVDDGVVFKGDQVVMPQQLRKEVKETIYRSHIGIEGCLRRARDCVYWPVITADLKEFVSKFAICNTYNSTQQRETFMNHEISYRPWQRVGVDLFQFPVKMK